MSQIKDTDGATDTGRIYLEMNVNRAAADKAATVTSKLQTYSISTGSMPYSKFVSGKAGFVDGKLGTPEALVAPAYDAIKKFEWAYYFAINYGNLYPAFKPVISKSVS